MGDSRPDLYRESLSLGHDIVRWALLEEESTVSQRKEYLATANNPHHVGYVTADLPGVGGRVRVKLEDFFVEELPLYEPAGEGQHTLFEIEKRGIDTMGAVRELSQALGIPSRHFGMAGLKDARAVTRQMLSVEGASPDAVMSVDLDRVRVLRAARHRNRLKIGHLRGNRFWIRIRDVDEGAMPAVRDILTVLEARGVPNGFGPQRFGARCTTHLLGRSLVRRDLDGFIWHLIGAPHRDDSPDVARARQLVDRGEWRAAHGAWPQRGTVEFRTLAMLADGRPPDVAVRRIRNSIKRLYVAAYQGWLFNAILARRLPAIDQLSAGDLAVKHVNGAFFRVEDAAVEQPRADQLDISPSGPLYGPKVRLATGDMGVLERAVLKDEDLTLSDWRVRGVPLRGDRRPLRVPVGDIDATYQEGVVLQFSLPSGAYATSVLAEVIKPYSLA